MSKNKYRASSSTTSTAFPLDFPAVSVAEIVEDDFPPLPAYYCYKDNSNKNAKNELPLCDNEHQQGQQEQQKHHYVHTRCDLCGLIIGFRRTVVACFHCTRPLCSYCANVLGIPGAVKTTSVAASPLQTVSSRLLVSPSVSIGRGGTVLGGVFNPFEDRLPNYMAELGPTPTPRASVSRTASVRATGRSTTPPPPPISNVVASPAPSPPRTEAARPANKDTSDDREGGETLQPLLDADGKTTTTPSHHQNNNNNNNNVKQAGETEKEQQKSNMAGSTATNCFDSDEAKSSGIFISNDENPLRTGIVGADQYFLPNNNNNNDSNGGDINNFTKTRAISEKKRGTRNMFMSSSGSGSGSSTCSDNDDGETPSPSRKLHDTEEDKYSRDLAHSNPGTLPTTEEIVNRPVDDGENPFTNPIRRNLRRFKHIDVNFSSGIVGLETTYRTSNGRDADHGEYIKKFVPRDAVFRTQYKKRNKNKNRGEGYGDVDNDDENDDFTQSFSGGVVSSGGLPKISTDSNYGDSSQEGEDGEYLDSILFPSSSSGAPSKKDGVNSKNDNLTKKTKQTSAAIVLPTDTDAISFAANNTPNHLSFTSNSTTTSNSKNISKILPSVLESVGISASQQSQQNTTAGPTQQQQKQQHMASPSDFNSNSVSTGSSSSNFLKRQMALLAQSHKVTDLLNELSSQQHHGAHAEPISGLKWALGSLSTATLTPNVQRVFADALSTRRCQLRNSGMLLLDINRNGMPRDAQSMTFYHSSMKEVDRRQSSETPRDCEGIRTTWTNGADPAIPFIATIPLVSQQQQQRGGGGGTLLQSNSFSQTLPSTSHSPLNSMINRNSHSGGNLTTQRHASLAARPPLPSTVLAAPCHVAKFWCGECDLKVPQVHTNHSQSTPAGHTNVDCSQKILREDREEGQRDASPSPAPSSSFRHRVEDDLHLPQTHFGLERGDNDLFFVCRRYPTVAITDPSDAIFVPFSSLQSHHQRSASHPHIPSTHSSFSHGAEDMMSNRSNNMSLASNPPLGGTYVASSSGHTAKSSNAGGPNSKIASSSGGSSSSGGGGGLFPPVYPPQHLFTAAGANVVDNNNATSAAQNNNYSTPTGTDDNISSRPTRSLPRTASAVYIPGAIVMTPTGGGTTSPKISTPTTPVNVGSTDEHTADTNDKLNSSYRQPNAAYSTASPSPRERSSPSSSQTKCQLCNKKFGGGGPFGSLFGGKKCTCDVCQRTICEGKCGKSVVRELDSLPEDVQRHFAGGGFKNSGSYSKSTASSSSSPASPTTQTSTPSPKSALSQSASHTSRGQGQGKAAVGTPSSSSSSPSPSRSRREGVVKLTMCNMCMLGQ